MIRPRYSVVILTYNSERYIEQCLNSLLDSFARIAATYEVFVIDNGSSDSTREKISAVKRRDDTAIELITFDCNTGTTFSRNRGLKRASGDYLIIMDSDAYVNPETLEALTLYLVNHPGCGMAVPALVYPDGRFQISTGEFPTFFHKIRRFFFLKSMEKNVGACSQQEGPVECAISAFWMMPAHIREDVGLLDEKIFYSPEDIDYCIRVWKAGYSIDYIPGVSMVHDAREISRAKGLKINRFTLSHAKGLLYLFLKHNYFLSAKTLRKKINDNISARDITCVKGQQ